jgi:manganese/zinc/iron transport system ATP- binding protein
MEPALKIEDLTVAYKDQAVVWDVDLEVPPGVLMAIMGPNGAGKTTLLKATLNLIKTASGQVKVFGQPYEKQRKKVAYVPQKGSVDWDFPITVLDVVQMGTYGRLGLIKRPGKKERKQAWQALAEVGMENFTNRQISQLSGGQQQRVFLARALVQQADIYFMDEPFQGVDAVTEKAIITILKDLKKQGKTLIVIHHDLQTVTEYFDWLMLLNVRKIASGQINTVFTQDNLRAAYGGKVAFLDYHKTPANGQKTND